MYALRSNTGVKDKIFLFFQFIFYSDFLSSQNKNLKYPLHNKQNSACSKYWKRNQRRVITRDPHKGNTTRCGRQFLQLHLHSTDQNSFLFCCYLYNMISFIFVVSTRKSVICMQILDFEYFNTCIRKKFSVICHPFFIGDFGFHAC